MNYYYDFHIHSALSPCAEEEMTPNNIVNMAMVNGLDIIAVTDHNAAGNLASAGICAEKAGILFLPGIEVESVEEIHIICLFAKVEAALDMERFLKKHLLPMENQEQIFGPQYLMDEEDQIIGKEPQMLLLSSDLSSEQVFKEAEQRGGAAYFAHIDRNSYSVLSSLGCVPQEIETGILEMTTSENSQALLKKRKDIKDYYILHSSDSHRLADISHRTWSLEIPIEKEKITSDDVIDHLRKMRRTK